VALPHDGSVGCGRAGGGRLPLGGALAARLPRRGDGAGERGCGRGGLPETQQNPNCSNTPFITGGNNLSELFPWLVRSPVATSPFSKRR